MPIPISGVGSGALDYSKLDYCKSSKPQTVSDGYHYALDDSCARMPQDLPAETRSGACLPGWPQTLTPPHKTQEAVYLLLGPSPRRAFPDHNKADDDDPARAFEASCYQARHATQENLSALTVIDLLQKRTVHFWNTVTCADAPPRPPTSCHLFANRAPPSSRSWPECATHPPEVGCHSRLASRQRHSEPLPCPLRRTGPVPTTTTQAVPRGRIAFHPGGWACLR